MNKTYICDPKKNKDCKKTSCQDLCFRTFHKEYSYAHDDKHSSPNLPQVRGGDEERTSNER